MIAEKELRINWSVGLAA